MTGKTMTSRNEDAAEAKAGLWVRVIGRRTWRLFGREEDEGSSLIEFALTLPVLLLVVTGTMTFGIAMNNYLSLTQATGVGARAIAIGRGQTLDPCSTGSSAFITSAPTLNSSKLTFSYVFNGVAYSGTTCSSSSTTTGAAGNLVQGQPAVMTVTYPCSLIAYNKNFVPVCNLQAQLTEVVQ
jgi:Flp pilus assembly protein TadG